MTSCESDDLPFVTCAHAYRETETTQTFHTAHICYYDIFLFTHLHKLHFKLLNVSHILEAPASGRQTRHPTSLGFLTVVK